MEQSDFLGKEKIFPLLIKLSLPAAIAMIVSSLYNVVDTIFVGQGVGPLGIAALSIIFPIQMIISAISQAIGVGASSIVSRKMGEKKDEEAGRASGTAISICIMSGLVLMTFVYIFLEPVLALFGASEAIMPFAKEYLIWVAPGFFFLSFSMAGTSIVRAVGKAKTAMVSMLLGTIINIILDPIFIIALEMGMKGAAMATVIGQFIAFIYILKVFVSGKGALKLTFNRLAIKGEYLWDSFTLGIPTLIQVGGMSVLIMIVNRSLGFFGGDLDISSYGIISKLFSMIIMPVMGIAQGFQPIAGYNYGAGKKDRVKEVLKYSIILSTIVAFFGWAVMNLFARPLSALFTENTELIELTAVNLRIFTGALIVLGVQLIGSIYFQAVGKKLPSLLLSLSRQFILLLPLLLVLPLFFGLNGIWFSFPVADFLAVVITVFALVREVRRLSVREPEDEPERELKAKVG